MEQKLMKFTDVMMGNKHKEKMEFWELWAVAFH